MGRHRRLVDGQARTVRRHLDFRSRGRTEPHTFTFAKNLWYAWDNPSQSEPNLPVTESDGIYGLDSGLDTRFRIDDTSLPSIGVFESR